MFGQFKNRLNIHDGFTGFKKITKDDYEKRKQMAYKEYINLYKL
jgi:hypothetical protein